MRHTLRLPVKAEASQKPIVYVEPVYHLIQAENRSTSYSEWRSMNDNSVTLPPIDHTLIELIDVLQSIDVDSKEAELNAVSISDNNGGRILL